MRPGPRNVGHVTAQERVRLFTDSNKKEEKSKIAKIPNRYGGGWGRDTTLSTVKKNLQMALEGNGSCKTKMIRRHSEQLST